MTSLKIILGYKKAYLRVVENLGLSSEQQLLSLEDKSMKMSRIALAMLVAAPLAAANAGVTVTPLMLGYTLQDTEHNNGGDHSEQTSSQNYKTIYSLVLHLVLNLPLG